MYTCIHVHSIHECFSSRDYTVFAFHFTNVVVEVLDLIKVPGIDVLRIFCDENSHQIINNNPVYN